jgi:cyanophycinase
MRRLLVVPVAALTAIPLLLSAQNPNPKPSGLTTYMTGNSANSSRQPVNGPAVLLMGGGSEVNSAFINRAYPVANGGDFVVLRTDNSNGYNSYFYNLVTGTLRPDSVETLVVNSRTLANSNYVKWAVENAELIWIAGGNQSAYMDYWLDTALETALRTAYNRGAVIGGTSAGNHVLGDWVYDPRSNPAVTSTEAIANPYRASMILSDFLVDLPLMYNTVTDTHFYQRDRMGRSMAFMARLRQDGRASSVRAICVDERAAIFIDRNRRGWVDVSGTNYVYVLSETANTQRTQVAANKPLIYRNIQRTRLAQGQYFDFSNGTTTGSNLTISVDGTKSTPFTPSNPY